MNVLFDRFSSTYHINSATKSAGKLKEKSATPLCASIKILPLLFVFLFAQCHSEEETEYNFSTKESIELTEIAYPDILGNTMQLVQWEDFLFVNDFFGDTLIHVYDTERKTIDKKLILKGNGPDELLSPLEIQRSGDDLYILSRPINTLKHISLSRINTNSIKLEHDIQLPPLSDCFVALGNSQFVFSGFWEKRYGYLNLKQGEEIREFGEYPDYWHAEENLPLKVKAFFHQCKFVKHPTKNLFASCSGYVLEIFEYDPAGINLPKLVFKKQLGKYSYTFTDGQFVSANANAGSDPSTKGIACSKDHIYIITSTANDKEKRDIMVINWKGAPIKLLQSDKKIICLTIDQEERNVYCIVEDGEDKLFSFELP